MKRSGFALLAGLAGLAVACTMVIVSDLEVRWSFSGTCAQYGIVDWEVTLAGPDSVAPTRVACSATGSYSSGMIEVVEGSYLASVRALNASGLQIGKPRTGSGLVHSGAGWNIIDVGTFTQSDLTGSSACGNGLCEAALSETCTSCPLDCGQCTADVEVSLWWTINDTEDGTDTGPSWDTCDEVGAAYLRLTIDGSIQQDLPCGGSTKRR